MRIQHILKEGYNAYVISDESRNELASIFPPKYPDWIGHHATLDFGVPEDPSLPYGDPAKIVVIGYAEEDGLEALVVSVNGEEYRPDGKRYHITWSLDRSLGKKPVHSNTLIQRGFTPVSKIPVSGQLKYISW
jgi:hypothetical protein